MSNVYLVFGVGKSGVGNVRSSCRNQSSLYTPGRQLSLSILCPERYISVPSRLSDSQEV